MFWRYIPRFIILHYIIIRIPYFKDAYVCSFIIIITIIIIIVILKNANLGWLISLFLFYVYNQVTFIFLFPCQKEIMTDIVVECKHWDLIKNLGHKNEVEEFIVGLFSGDIFFIVFELIDSPTHVSVCLRVLPCETRRTFLLSICTHDIKINTRFVDTSDAQVTLRHFESFSR